MGHDRILRVGVARENPLRKDLIQGKGADGVDSREELDSRFESLKSLHSQI